MARKKLQKPSDNKLVDGVDSGAVPKNVLHQLLADCGGVCSTPECDNPIIHNLTLLGECAHIMPRIVGSHPREDYKTSLSERSKCSNLLYLCKSHHKIVDDKQHAKTYTADILCRWKEDHESFVRESLKKKNRTSIPDIIKPGFDKILNLAKEALDSSHIANFIIETILDSCCNFMRCHHLSAAETLLFQLGILLIDSKNQKHILDYKLLNAIFLAKSENVVESKKSLLELINEFPHDINLMLEYIELCHNAPENGDKIDEMEDIVRRLEPKHPRLMLLDLERKYRNMEGINEDIPIKKWSDDEYINGKILCLYSLLLNQSNHPNKRDYFIDSLENQQPNSPKPNLLRILFKITAASQNVLINKAELTEAFNVLNSEKEKISKKDPLSSRDKILLLVQELSLYLCLSRVSSNIPKLDDIYSEIINLICKCYFDVFVNNMLELVLFNTIINKEDFEKILNKINESKVIPSDLLIELLFIQSIQYDFSNKKISKLLKNAKRHDLIKILSLIKEENASEISKIINKIINNGKKKFFPIFFLRALPNRDFALQFKGLFSTEGDTTYEEIIIYAEIFARKGMYDEALNLAKHIPLDLLSPYALSLIEQLSFKSKFWDLFIDSATIILQKDIHNEYKSYIYPKLAFAYYTKCDDANAITYANLSLNYQHLLEENELQMSLLILAKSTVLRGDIEGACEIFSKNRHIKRYFNMSLFEAKTYLQSSRDEKYYSCLSTILKAFYELDTYNDEIFSAAFFILNELAGLDEIPFKPERFTKDGFFIQVSGFDKWFHLGKEDECFDAININKNDQRYSILAGKFLNEEFIWPPDKYSRKCTRRILLILTPAAYLLKRSHTAIGNIAESGNGEIWKVEMVDEHGRFNPSNLIKFMQEKSEKKDQFFENYKKQIFPFSLLCKSEGGIIPAIGRIVSENQGYIRCNNSSPNDMQRQLNLTQEILNGKPCVVDGFTSFILLQSGFLELVLKSVPNLYISLSTIRLLREIAESLNTSTSSNHIGRAKLVNNRFQYFLKDKDWEENFRKNLLAGANILDSHNKRFIPKQLKETKQSLLDDILPEDFVYSFRHAQEKRMSILTDDFHLITAYKACGEEDLPEQFSSFSLIRQMVDLGYCSWDDYLNFFQFLSHYRYYFLSISVDDLKRSVLTLSSTGVFVVSPRNLHKLNLGLTLSENYGIQELNAATVIAEFFKYIILDDSIIEESAKEVFYLMIESFFHNRQSKNSTKLIFQLTTSHIKSDDWLTNLAQRKIKILEQQLSKVDYFYIHIPTPGEIQTVRKHLEVR